MSAARPAPPDWFLPELTGLVMDAMFGAAVAQFGAAVAQFGAAVVSARSARVASALTLVPNDHVGGEAMMASAGTPGRPAQKFRVRLVGGEPEPAPPEGSSRWYSVDDGVLTVTVKQAEGTRVTQYSPAAWHSIEEFWPDPNYRGGAVASSGAGGLNHGSMGRMGPGAIGRS